MPLGLKRRQLFLKIWGKPLPRNYLCFIWWKLLKKNINYLINRLDYQSMFLGMSLHTYTKKMAGCIGYLNGLLHYCLLKSSREHHKLFFLKKISKVFFDVACDWFTMYSILRLKTWIFNKKNYREAGKWWGCLCKPTESGLYYCPFYENKNIIIPLIVKETTRW